MALPFRRSSIIPLPALSAWIAAFTASPFLAHAALIGHPDPGTPPSFPLLALGYGLAALVVAIAVANLGKEARRTRELTAALQEHKELLHVFTEGVEHSAVFLLDAEGRIKSWNIGAERLFGYKSREAIGKGHSFLYPKDEIQAGKAETGIKMAGSEGRHESIGWHLRKNGSTATTFRSPPTSSSSSR
ncbi:MAG: PAS domain S-box protein [Nitrospirota bacterium]